MILHRTPLVALLALPNSNMREEKKILVLVVYSVFQGPGFRIPQTKLISRIPEFLFLYMGR